MEVHEERTLGEILQRVAPIYLKDYGPGNTSTITLRCLLYTSDAADDLLCVDLGGRRIIKNKNRTTIKSTLKIQPKLVINDEYQ